MPRKTPRTHLDLSDYRAGRHGLKNTFECKIRILSFVVSANSREGHVRDSPTYISMCPYIHTGTHTHIQESKWLSALEHYPQGRSVDCC